MSERVRVDVVALMVLLAVFLIAGMLPLGLALQKSGDAQFLTEGVVSAVGGLGPSPWCAWRWCWWCCPWCGPSSLDPSSADVDGKTR